MQLHLSATYGRTEDKMRQTFQRNGNCLERPCKTGEACPSLSFLVLPCPSLSFLVLPCPSLSFLVLPCPSLSFLVLPCPSLSFLVLPCPSLSFMVLCPSLSFVLPCPLSFLFLPDTSYSTLFRELQLGTVFLKDSLAYFTLLYIVTKVPGLYKQNCRHFQSSTGRTQIYSTMASKPQDPHQQSSLTGEQLFGQSHISITINT